MPIVLANVTNYSDVDAVSGLPCKRLWMHRGVFDSPCSSFSSSFSSADFEPALLCTPALPGIHSVPARYPSTTGGTTHVRVSCYFEQHKEHQIASTDQRGQLSWHLDVALRNHDSGTAQQRAKRQRVTAEIRQA